MDADEPGFEQEIPPRLAAQKRSEGGIAFLPGPPTVD